MKDIKDYLHLYVGASIRYGAAITIRPLTISEMAVAQHILEDVKLVLRPLSDMTEEERCEVSTLVPPDESPYWVKNIAEVTKWYLDRGFDLFGLIEAGLAIDKTDRN